MDSEPKKTDGKLTRRQFLKGAAAFATSIVLKGSIPLPAAEMPPQKEKEAGPKLLHTDIFNAEEMRKKMIVDIETKLGKSEAEILAKMSVSDPSTEEGLSQAVMTDETQFRVFLAYGLYHRYGEHGENVGKVRQQAEEKYNPDINKRMPLEQQSIVPAIKIRNVHFDELGNPSAEIFVDPEEVDKLIAASDAKVVSMSYILGIMDVKYDQYSLKKKYSNEPEPNDNSTPTKNLTTGEEMVVKRFTDGQGNEISEQRYIELKNRADEQIATLIEAAKKASFTDGYYGKHTYDNLKLLALLAKKHPDKIFVAAGGNPFRDEKGTHTPDITGAKEKLIDEGLWGNNIVIAGAHGVYNDEGYTSDGADIYLNGKDLFGSTVVSSNATQVVAEASRKLLRAGVKDSDIVTTLQRYSKLNTLDLGGWSVNEEKLVEKFRNYYVLDANNITSLSSLTQ